MQLDFLIVPQLTSSTSDRQGSQGSGCRDEMPTMSCSFDGLQCMSSKVNICLPVTYLAYELQKDMVEQDSWLLVGQWDNGTMKYEVGAGGTN